VPRRLAKREADRDSLRSLTSVDAICTIAADPAA
jgi:hypothetical protein